MLSLVGNCQLWHQRETSKVTADINGQVMGNEFNSVGARIQSKFDIGRRIETDRERKRERRGWFYSYLGDALWRGYAMIHIVRKSHVDVLFQNEKKKLIYQQKGREREKKEGAEITPLKDLIKIYTCTVHRKLELLCARFNASCLWVCCCVWMNSKSNEQQSSQMSR